MSDLHPNSTILADTSPLNYKNDAAGMIASCSIFSTLATIAVVLRYYSRHLSGASWQLDDWLSLAALLSHHGLLIASAVMTLLGGLGRDIRLVKADNPTSISILYKSMLAVEVFYGLSATLVKLSVLALYWRIFPTNTVRYSCYVLASISIMWMLAIEITNFLQCRPLQAFWDLDMQDLSETKCIDTILYFLGNSVANCIIDLATIIIPIKPVMGLQINRSKKIAIIIIFLLGSLAFISSLVRTITVGIMWKDGNINFTKQFVVPGVAGVLEIYVAIVGACLPVMTPVYHKLRYGDAMRSKTNMTAPKSSSQTAWKQTSKDGEQQYGRVYGSFARLHDNEHEPSHMVAITSWQNTDSEFRENGQIPLEGIVVRSDLTWTNTTQAKT